MAADRPDQALVFGGHTLCLIHGQQPREAVDSPATCPGRVRLELSRPEENAHALAAEFVNAPAKGTAFGECDVDEVPGSNHDAMRRLIARHASLRRPDIEKTQ
jgi:hypothetical protein